MRPVSAAFLETIRGPHKMVIDARVLTTFQTGPDPVGLAVGINEGDVSFEASADVRATIDCEVDGTGWVPRPGNAFTPYGNELFVRRGVELSGGTREWVSLGYYQIRSVAQDSPPDGPLRITGQDRMGRIVRAKLLAPRQYAASLTVGAVVNDLVLDVYPGAEIEYDDGTSTSGQTIGRGILVEDDRFAALRDLVRAYGKVAFWDHEGRLQIRTAPNPLQPVFTVNHGKQGVLVELNRSIDVETTFNAVVAEGEGGDDKPPVRAVARDMNPTSPTYWYGTFGQVPAKISSPFITIPGQAATAAMETLARSLGLPYHVDFTMVPNPALEVLDPVKVTFANNAPAEVHVIDTLSVGLSVEAPMPATTRDATQQTIETGEG